MIHSDGYMGMHFIWWIIWGLFLFWIFALPYEIPGQRKSKDTPLGILQRRFASGQLTSEQYEEHKRILQSDSAS